MIKYNHTHLPAKRHTGLFKPCSIDNNGKFTVRVFRHYKKGKTYFLNTLEADFWDTLKNFGKPQFKRLPQNRATSNILGVINDFSEQYAHVRSETKLDFSESIKKGLHGVEFKNKKLINLEFLQQYTHARSKTKVKDLINSAFETLNSINALTHNKYEGYYKDLSNSNSGQPFRYLLAFFVPDNWLNSQLNQSISTKPPILSQDRTVISMVKNLPPSYNGLTLQNKKALWRICRAVSVRAESKTRYPMFNHIVAFTQNLTGGHNHA